MSSSAPPEPRRDERDEGGEGGEPVAGVAGRHFAMALLIAGAAAFVLGFLVTAVLFYRSGGGADVVTMPDLRGRPEAEARQIAEREGLTIEIGATLVNPEVPEGHVLAQSPLPGQETSPAGAVHVTISAGRERRPVPDVRVYGAQQASTILAQAGFEVRIEETPDPRPAGRILEIRPAPGTPVELPALVELLVSAGPPLAPVPSVLGLSEAEGRGALDAAGFVVEVIDYDPFAPPPAGRVIAQWPDGGSEAPVGSAVRLTIAGGPVGNP